jgi:hypothetical protein
VSPSPSDRFVAGVNLPVLQDDYNHDLAPNERFPDWGDGHDPIVGYRYLAMCRELGFDAVRIWLCEDGEGVVSAGPGPLDIRVRSRLTDSLDVLQEGARLAGLQLYWTLLDANAWQHSRHELTRDVAASTDAARRFAERIAAPLVERMDPAVTFAIEVFNEPEVLSQEVIGDEGLAWPTITASIRAVREVVHQARPGVLVTSGSQPVFLPGLFADGGAPVDAIDLHVYHHDGGLPSREDLPVDIGDLPLWAGECGTSDQAEPGRTDYLIHYLFNARALGYEAAFLWRLEDHLVRWKRHEDREGHGFELLPLGNHVRHLLRDEWTDRKGGGPSS